MSPITTHILDTTRGKPAEGVAITLYQYQQDEWLELATGRTNADGRISNLLTDAIPSGTYKLHFETQPYFNTLEISTFYPYVDIIFSIVTGEHYHVPLLLNPFGYSTYRGS
ncbi:hydroxyisourate hydrolase [Spirosoma sp. KNUC1025]|uniref:hydroxyisourate hydrolase n=1 Tax=Spirosoma sp. KNUC1025 TaxID=2894082 RepID=UPI0038683270|nr:hydroxyisourate hydrolase [Spirosoma sp. KNUC1025]